MHVCLFVEPNQIGVQFPSGPILINMIVIHLDIIYLRKDLTLRNVLHVPKLMYNFAIQSKLSKDANCATMFYPKSIIYQGFSNGSLFQIGNINLAGVAFVLEYDIKMI